MTGMTMDPCRFVRGLLASLCLEGVTRIVVCGDAHHVRFKLVLEAIERLKTERRKGAESLPLFIPSPFTGRYREFDTGLLVGATGITTVSIRAFRAPEVSITVSRARARDVLRGFTAPERDLLRELARVFSGSPDLQAA